MCAYTHKKIKFFAFETASVCVCWMIDKILRITESFANKFNAEVTSHDVPQQIFRAEFCACVAHSHLHRIFFLFSGGVLGKIQESIDYRTFPARLSTITSSHRPCMRALLLFLFWIFPIFFSLRYERWPNFHFSTLFRSNDDFWLWQSMK